MNELCYIQYSYIIRLFIYVTLLQPSRIIITQFYYDIYTTLEIVGYLKTITHRITVTRDMFM